MDVTAPKALLGGISPADFVRRYWGRKPVLVRAAWPGVQPPLSRSALFRLAGQEGVESRLVRRDGESWRVLPGPQPRRRLPPVARAGWTLLVQGLDLHHDAARALLDAFRFLPDARLDDLMLSWASDGGGVGPHVDAYDVFLLQVAGQRRWRVGRARDRRFVEGLPLKILRHFEPEHDWLLDPGDLLYLPPGWGHEGVAEGECMTASIGYRAPSVAELQRDLLPRLAEAIDDAGGGPRSRGSAAGRRYSDSGRVAALSPAAIPPALQSFAREGIERALADPVLCARVLGEWLSEPKADVWFDGDDHDLADAPGLRSGVRLDRRSRMLYDAHFLYLNGEAFRAAGRDRTLLCALADARALAASDCRLFSTGARAVVRQWLEQGWLRPDTQPGPADRTGKRS